MSYLSLLKRFLCHFDYFYQILIVLFSLTVFVDPLFQESWFSICSDIVKNKAIDLVVLFKLIQAFLQLWELVTLKWTWMNRNFSRYKLICIKSAQNSCNLMSKFDICLCLWQIKRAGWFSHLWFYVAFAINLIWHV